MPLAASSPVLRHFVPEFGVSVEVYTEQPAEKPTAWYTAGIAGVLFRNNKLCVTQEGRNVRVLIQTVPLWLKQRIAAALNEHYRFAPGTIRPSQVLPLPYTIFEAAFHVSILDSIRCYTCSAENTGAYDPIELNVPLPSAAEASDFCSALITPPGVSIRIRWSVGGAVELKEKTLNILGSMTQAAALEASLFGPADEVFVTRTQLCRLAQQLSRELTIEETRAEGQTGFSEDFITSITKSILESKEFHEVPIDQVVSGLSAFGLGIDPKDLSPSTIRSLIGRDVKVVYDKIEGSRHDASREKDTKNTKASEASAHENSTGGGGNVGIPGYVSAGGNYEQGSKNTKESQQHIEDLRDRSREHDSTNKEVKFTQSDLYSEFHGNVCIPKSLRVARLSKSTWQKGISVRRSEKILVRTTLEGGRRFRSEAEKQHSFPPFLLGVWCNRALDKLRMHWRIEQEPELPDGPRFRVVKVEEPHFSGYIEVLPDGNVRLFVSPSWPSSLWVKIESGESSSTIRIFDAENFWQPHPNPHHEDAVWTRAWP